MRIDTLNFKFPFLDIHRLVSFRTFKAQHAGGHTFIPFCPLPLVCPLVVLYLFRNEVHHRSRCSRRYRYRRRHFR